MTCFFKVLHSSLKLALIGCYLLVPMSLMSQDAVGLTPSESVIFTKSMQLLAKEKFAYIAVHGIGDGFKVWEVDKGWKMMGSIPGPVSVSLLSSGTALAKWIAENRMYDNKTIVLLSGGNWPASQNLADELFKLDNAATPKRTQRNVIGWDEGVVVFENGYVRGDGICRLFTPLSKSTEILAPAIPIGSGVIPAFTSEYILLYGNSDQKKQIEALDPTLFTSSAKKNLIKSWNEASRVFKKKYAADPSIIYMDATNNPNIISVVEIFNVWLYLRTKVKTKTNLTGIYSFMMNVHAIFNKPFYKENGIGKTKPKPPLSALPISIQAAFDAFLEGGNDKEETIKLLALLPNTAPTQTAIDLMNNAGTSIAVDTYLSNYKLAPANHFEKNLAILDDKLPEFVNVMRAFQAQPPTVIPRPVPVFHISTQALLKNEGLNGDLLEKLVVDLSSNIIKGTKLVDDARNNITGAISPTIGIMVSYADFMALTKPDGLMNPLNPNSLQIMGGIKGGIFEYWGIKAINDMPLNKFPLLPETILKQLNLTQKIQIERKNPPELVGVTPQIIVDGYFKMPNPDVKSTNKTLLVAVEFKHAKEVPAEELAERKLILALKTKDNFPTVSRFIYVFAELPI
jgi:hypothetical protein